MAYSATRSTVSLSTDITVKSSHAFSLGVAYAAVSGSNKLGAVTQNDSLAQLLSNASYTYSF
jgi:hypothetical protein